MSHTFRFLTCCCLLGAATTTVAQPAGGVQIALVEAVDTANETLTVVRQQTTYQNVTKQVEVKVLDNGIEKTVVKTVTETVPVTQQVKLHWSAKSHQALDATGKALAKETVLKRLKPGTAVLVLPAGQNFNPAIQRLLDKDAVTLVINDSK